MSSFKIGDRAWNIGNYWVEIEEVEIASELKEEAMAELSRRKKREIEKIHQRLIPCKIY